MLSFWGWRYTVPGGVQTLILNLAKEANKANDQIKLYGIKSSFLYQSLISEKVKFAFVDIDKINLENRRKFIQADDLFIITGYDKDFVKLIQYNPKIIFWVVYPTTIVEANSYKRIHLKFLTKTFYKIMLKNNSIFFMDESCLKVSESITNIKISKDLIIPIPIAIPSQNYFLLTSKVNLTQDFNISYIGRAVNFKLYPLIRVYEDLNKIIKNNGYKINLHIITDEYSYFENHIPKGKLKCFYHIDLHGAGLSEFLRETIHLNISMGTSSLESASLGIPTLLMDASYKPFPENYLYKWLFETTYFNLGEIINNQKSFQGEKLESIVSSLIEDENSTTIISEKCYDYVVINHSIAKTYRLLKNQETPDKLNLKEVSKYLLRSNSFFY